MHSAWAILVRYWPELVETLVFALLAAVIVDFLQIGSRMRGWVRRFRNQMAEQSIASLRTRIQKQERYRDTVASYLTSDKVLYLHTLGMVFAVLLLMCGGAVILLLERIMPVRGVEILASGMFIIAMLCCAYGLRLASLDTRPKVEELLAKLDAEIAGMKAKLDGITK